MKTWIRFAIFLLIVLALSFARESYGILGTIAGVIYFVLVAMGLSYVFEIYERYQVKREDEEFKRAHDGFMIKVEGKRFGTIEEYSEFRFRKYGA